MDRRADVREAIVVAGECGITLEPERDRTTLRSRRDRFRGFEIAGGLRWWSAGPGPIDLNNEEALFDEAALRMAFGDGTALLIYPSGHIRCLTADGFRYYARLSRGRKADDWQGDLVVFHANGLQPGALREELAGCLRAAAGPLWWEPGLDGETPELHWLESAKLFIGPNRRHRVLGELRYQFLLRADSRTVLIEALEDLDVVHDPTDAIHPRLRLPGGRRYLVSKLPGFSDPGDIPGSGFRPV